MIVWGGQDCCSALNTGGRYDPTTDSWTATSTINAPSGRIWHTAVWTGSEMLVWGGYDDGVVDFNTGGRYNPSTDTWTATATANAPNARQNHTAVWTGSEMVVWGGVGDLGYSNTGGRYDPSTDSWTVISTTNAPNGRYDHTAVWTGSKMIVWGGTDDSNVFDTGGRYDPSTDSWIATNSTTNTPTARYGHTAVWTGTKMIVWGGYSPPNYLNTGGRYNPTTDSWGLVSTTGAPSTRWGHTAVWTGSEMVVWGGYFVTLNRIPRCLNTGGRYNPSTDSWTATSTSNAPEARYTHTAVWTDSEMVAWGGLSDFGVSNTGGKFLWANAYSNTNCNPNFDRNSHANGDPNPNVYAMYREMYTYTKTAPNSGTAPIASLDEKQPHYSIRVLPAAGFNYSPSLRSRMFDRHRNPLRFRQFHSIS